MSTAEGYGTDLALRATRLLAEFNRAGILTSADVHVATRLGALLGERDDRVLLAVALTVRSTRQGSVVLDLAAVSEDIAPTVPGDGGQLDAPDLPWPDLEGWLAACAASPITTRAVPPVRQRGARLWLARYDGQEQQVVDELRGRTGELPDDLDPSILRAGLERLFPDPGDLDQRNAAAVCSLSRISVLAGGPGTGKTTSVSRVLALLREQHPDWRIALAAPTGKAAARLEEAVAASTALFSDPADRERLGHLDGVTLHRLLGWRPGSASRFRHDHGNRLPFEVVVVDEASMVSLTMMARLLEALRPSTRLMLVGDPDQLASVEAGAVLNDLIDRDLVGARTERLGRLLDEVTPQHASRRVSATPTAYVRDGIAALSVNHRFRADSTLGRLADAIRVGDSDTATGLVRSGDPAVEFLEIADDAPLAPGVLGSVRADAVAWGKDLRSAGLGGDHGAALLTLDRHRILCAHREGPRGARRWEALAQRWLAEDDPDLLGGRADGHYAGQPLIVTTNDYELGLFNGDTGVVVASRADDAGGLRAWFSRGGDPIGVPLVRLGAVRPVHAMTVHRSQGSQFVEVTVVLPPARSPLATRGTLYTAVTRSMSRLRIVGSLDALAAAVQRPAPRATGLRERLAE